MLNLSQKNLNLLKTPYGFLALGFGSGLVRFAPGTFGAIVGLLLGVLLVLFFETKTSIAILIISYFAGIWICDKAANFLQDEDPSQIVWDEIVAMTAIIVLMPVGFADSYFSEIIIAFILFRLFDIIKPFKIKQVERAFKGGMGIMIDDILAATYGLIVIYILYSLKFLGVTNWLINQIQNL